MLRTDIEAHVVDFLNIHLRDCRRIEASYEFWWYRLMGRRSVDQIASRLKQLLGLAHYLPKGLGARQVAFRHQLIRTHRCHGGSIFAMQTHEVLSAGP